MNAIVGGLVVGLLGCVVILKLRQAGASPPATGPPVPAPPGPQAPPEGPESPAMLMLRYQKLMQAEADRKAAEDRHKRFVDDWAAAQTPFWAAPKSPSEAPKA